MIKNSTLKEFCVLVMLTFSFINASAQYDLVVAKDGTGNYTTVQAAINAAPAGRTTAYKIFIKNGKYKEKINIPSNKPFIELIGESVANTTLTYNDAASTPLPGGGTIGTFNSASIIINAPDFAAVNITFENSFGDGSQAVAVQVNADRAAFYNCRFLGNQDTLLTNGTSGYRQYFKNCYIDGNIDFIFGSAIAVFDSCIIYAKTRTTSGSSFITAANTQAGQAYGYVFRGCKIPANTGGTTYYLGRPWQNSTGSSPFANNKVVFLNALLGYTVRPEGWVIWDAGTNTSLIYYGEYKSMNFDGSLTNISQRVPWSFQLADADTLNYSLANMFGSWNPCSSYPELCSFTAPSVVVSNFKGTKGSTTSSFTWNISWPMDQVKYELFRSSDNINFSKIGEVNSINDTAVNYGLTDPVPPPGSTYYYYLKASKTGLNSQTTDTISISSTPTITITGTLNNFLQGLGTPSAVQAYVVSGTNLTAGITITPPAGYEISSDGGTTWFNNSNPLTLAQNSGSIGNTNISVRLNASAAGAYNDSILHVSSGAVTVKLAVNGTVQSTPLQVSNVLLHWPFDINNSDSAVERSPGVTASTSSLNKLFLSNGTQLPAVAAYTTTYGQAFGPSANGDGTWTTAVGGPGGNLNRTFYEQFTVTSSGGTVRVDSIILNGSFYNTSSNTKFAAVYSRSGFTSDSSDITGGTGLGTALLSTANGAFATPILLGNETAGTNNNYRLALAGATGVTIAAGNTLTIRFYFSCGSTSAGRYGKIKDVYIKGQANTNSPVITTLGSLGNFTSSAGVPSATKTYSVAGSYLTSGITITAPAGFEVSPDNGATWYNNSSPALLAQTGGNVASTNILVRLNAATAGNYSGNITNASTGAAVVNIPVSGAVQSVSLPSGTLPAFPGAEGFGRFSTGGRGGSVYEVTNLNDAGPGSLRDAVSQPNRTVVFKVSGTIKLNSTLKITKNNITIAGQTAPGDGICVSQYTVTIEASNVIVRYIRFRLGDLKGVVDDACNGYHGPYHDIIVDHCSMSWSVDETGTFYDIQNFTLQWSILSESLFHSIDPKGDHGYAGIWGGQGATFHHNLLAHHTSRNPRFSGSRYYGDSITGTADMRNNVIYNWGNINSAYGGEGGMQNMVNNYYKPGPATPGSLTVSSPGNKRNRILNYTSYYYASDAAVYPDTLFGGQFYIDGNYVEGYPDVSADNWTNGVQPDGYYRASQLMAAARQTSPFPFAPVTTQTAQDAYLAVLNNAGAILPKRDTVDRRILRETRTGTATFEGSGYASVNGTGITHPSGIIDSQNDVGGWPILNSATPPADADHDGMPDYWETARGLNPLDSTDRNGINPNGYTNLENYLNGDSTVALSSPNTCAGTAFFTSSSSGNWVHAKDMSNALQVPTDTMNLIASIKDNGNYGTFKAGYYTSNTIRVLPTGKPYLNRNIVLVPLNNSAIIGPITVRLYFTKDEFNALKAVDTSIKTVADLSILRTSDTACIPAANSFYIVIIPTASGLFGTFNNGYYVEFTTSTFGNFFIAGSKVTVAPSFILTSFTGSFNNAAVNLSWSSAYEIITKNYVIQRSADTVNFVSIDSVAAKGTAINNYTYSDKTAPNGVSYYRLKIVNSNGGIQYSPVIAVTGLNLLSFNAIYINRVVKTSWNTASVARINNFIVERSSDNNNFTTVGTVQVKDSIGHFSYSLYDTDPFASLTWYRLRIINKDSSLEISQPVLVGSDLAGRVIVFPNPAHNTITVAFEKAGANATLQLCNEAGQTIKAYQLPAGSTQITINVVGLARGTYMIFLKSNGKKIVRRFIKG